MVIWLPVREFERGRSVLARLDFGTEIVESITSLAEKLGVEAGVFSTIGALKEAELGYYEQDTHQYKTIKMKLYFMYNKEWKNITYSR